MFRFNRRFHKKISTHSLRTARLKEGGFSLLELLLVLGIIGAVAGFILPNLSFTVGSQMSSALREFSLALRNSYDSAVLTGKVHRVVIEIKKGDYWTEAAPAGYTGRPPIANDDEESARAEERARLLEELNEVAANPRKASDGKRDYTERSILVIHRNILEPIRWNEVDDAVLSKRSLPGSVTFVSLFTPAMKQKLEFQTAEDKAMGYIYFFPSGEALAAAIQLGTKTSDGGIADNGPRFTLKLDPLSGHSEILDGLHDIDFKGDD